MSRILTERAAIEKLKKLAEQWPKDLLWVFAADGQLIVLRLDKDGKRVMTSSGGYDGRNIVAVINIPADGGDW